MEIQVGKIVGKMEAGVWGQIHDFYPEEEGNALVKGRMFAVVSREGEDIGAVKTVEQGREILGRLHELYFGGDAVGLLGVKEAVNMLLDEYPDVEVEVAVVVGEVVYVVLVGEGGVWVKSGDKEGWIVDPQPREEMVALSGKISEDKLLAMGNGKWWKKMTPEQIRMATENDDWDGGVDLLSAAVHGGENTMGEIGLIIKFSLEPVVTEAEELADEPIKAKKTKIWEKIRLPKMALKNDQAVYVGHEEKQKKSKKTRVAAGVFAALLLLIGLGGRIKVQNQNKLLDENNKLVEDMWYKFKEAKGVAEMNPARARQLVPTIQEEIATLEKNKVKDTRIAEAKSQLGEVLGVATGTKPTNLVNVMDLSLVRDGFLGDKLALSDGKLVVADVAGDRLALVDVDKKNGKIIGGKDGLGDIKLVTGYPGKIEAFSDKGVVEVPADGVNSKVKIAKDEGWGNIVDMKMFAGNIYMLDVATGDIWRYQGDGESFGKRQSWLADDTGKSELKFGKSMAIDGGMWVAGGQGSLWKFTQGVKENITVSGWDKPWGDNVVIYTDDSAEKLYVLDRDNGRIMVIKKTGEYEMQLVNEQIKNMQDIVVDEKDKKIYLVGQGKIWEVDL